MAYPVYIWFGDNDRKRKPDIETWVPSYPSVGCFICIPSAGLGAPHRAVKALEVFATPMGVGVRGELREWPRVNTTREPFKYPLPPVDFDLIG